MHFPITTYRSFKIIKFNCLLSCQNKNKTSLIEQRNRAQLIKKRDIIKLIKNYEKAKLLNDCYFKLKIVNDLGLYLYIE